MCFAHVKVTVKRTHDLCVYMYLPVFLRFSTCEGHSSFFWSQGVNAVLATLPSRAQAHRWAGSLDDNLNFHMSMEGFSQTPR